MNRYTHATHIYKRYSHNVIHNRYTHTGIEYAKDTHRDATHIYNRYTHIVIHNRYTQG